MCFGLCDYEHTFVFAGAEHSTVNFRCHTILLTFAALTTIMITFFSSNQGRVIAVGSHFPLTQEANEKLKWLFEDSSLSDLGEIQHSYIGPRREMVSPWSTNAVEITQNMGIQGIFRIEEFQKTDQQSASYDPMLYQFYDKLDQHIFTIEREAEPVKYIKDIHAYNLSEGLALSEQEVSYLTDLAGRLGRNLTDSEIFGFSQVNSEHCRHKIFNGTFIINGKKQELSLFQLIKETTKQNPNRVVSAYKDNCAFIQGPVVQQFAPQKGDEPSWFAITDYESVISLKAETHNFPTTVEPFNGAATGTGGEIRDRLAGGKGAQPLAGTAVYMTSYPRLTNDKSWENNILPRKWLYQTPSEILIKASNGASDFGNKFGQPLICGSVLTFEHEENGKTFGFDKVIMLAGGIGYGKKSQSMKDIPQKDDAIILLGGDNYRIGMGGGAVSSVATGEFRQSIELNAVQRSNPEMQKRVSNAIRAMSESEQNPIVSIHDHGAGGHLNCLSELVEETGGEIEISKLPIGDPTLSDREIIGNESQERMGLILRKKDVNFLKKIAERERAPMYEIGQTTGDMQFTFLSRDGKMRPMNLALTDMFGNPPATIMNDQESGHTFNQADIKAEKIYEYTQSVLQLEAVACKDWLTNKVDRSVTGKVAKQQTCGELQLPLNNVGVSAIDYLGEKGIATAIGHAPVAALADASRGSKLAIAEALSNLVFAPIEGKLSGVSLSANWMWPCKNQGEDARLYKAVESASQFAIALGINIPTGKDSLSMTQKYSDDKVVYSPGTVIISAAGEVTDVKKIVEPVLQDAVETELWYIDLSSSLRETGGSSLAQVLGKIGGEVPDMADPAYFKTAFNGIQKLIEDGLVLAGHDISSGGLITCLLEMCFAQTSLGLEIDLSTLAESDDVKLLFSENPGIILQVIELDKAEAILRSRGVSYHLIGTPVQSDHVKIFTGNNHYSFNVSEHRKIWYKTSALLNDRQTASGLAVIKEENYVKQGLNYSFPDHFTGQMAEIGLDPLRTQSTGVKTAIIREKGVNGDREMAWAMYLAGMDVKDVHMTDLISGRENLEDVNMIVFVGGFSNSDVLGSAKGWAGAFLYNPKAKTALENFYAREDTLSLGVCNGCQLMVHLGLTGNSAGTGITMKHNTSFKFESAFVNVNIPDNHSVMLQSLAGTRLGIWIAHGEGRFSFAAEESKYNIPLKYSFSSYPGNPNGSDFNAAAVCSADGRHLAMMPHLERSIHPWNWAHYPVLRRTDQVTPWIEAFINARNWIIRNKK
ncbi:MAG: phosphoribosylformylglycinamidine synthase [Cyclobacteriaceae bacterium]|nr:phosphoribosylformylglycinamidine synthase [Cyclobacteriaceae bacterium]